MILIHVIEDLLVSSDPSHRASTIKADVARPFTSEICGLPVSETLQTSDAGVVAPPQLNIIHKPDYRLVAYSSNDAQPGQPGEPVAQ